MEEHDKAITDFDASMKLDAEDPYPCGNCAWVLATYSDARYRDGTKAVKYATRACALTDWKHESGLGALAAAYAELGDVQKDG